MAGHHSENVNGKQQGAKSKEGHGAAEPFYQTKGKIMTPVQGFSGDDVLSTPPSPARLRGDTHSIGSRALPLSAKNPSTNALSAFGLNNTTPGKKAR